MSFDIYGLGTKDATTDIISGTVTRDKVTRNIFSFIHYDNFVIEPLDSSYSSAKVNYKFNVFRTTPTILSYYTYTGNGDSNFEIHLDSNAKFKNPDDVRLVLMNRLNYYQYKVFSPNIAYDGWVRFRINFYSDLYGNNTSYYLQLTDKDHTNPTTWTEDVFTNLFNFTPSGGSTKYKVTSTLSNCTLTPTDTEIDEGTVTDFIVTANSGYTFNTAPTLNGEAMEKTSDTVYHKSITVNADVDIIATANKIPVTYSITANGTNGTVTPTQFTEGVETVVTLNASDGYEFQTGLMAPYIDFTDDDSNNISMTRVSNTQYTYTIPTSIRHNATVTFYTKAITKPTFTVAYDLTNCTSDETRTSFEQGSEVSFTVTANSGYHFDTAPTIGNLTMTKVSDTEYYRSITITENVTLTATAVEDSKPIVTKNIVNSGSNVTVTPTTYTVGESTTITATANNGYDFKNSTPYVEYETSSGETTNPNMTKVSDTVYTYDIPTTVNTDITVYANASPIIVYRIDLTSNVTNSTATAKINGVDATTWTDGDTIVFDVVADTNYTFSVAPFLKLDVSQVGATDELTMDKVSDEHYTYSLNTTNQLYHTITVHSTPIAKTPVSEKYGLTSTYIVNDDIVNAIAYNRFDKSPYDLTDVYQDLTTFINDYYVVPFDVTSDVLQAFVISDKTIATSCPVVAEDVVTKTVLDKLELKDVIQDTVITIDLPYNGLVEIDSNYYLQSETLSVTISLNLITGDATYKIYSNETLVTEVSCKTKVRIPFATSESVYNKLEVSDYYTNITSEEITVTTYNPNYIDTIVTVDEIKKVNEMTDYFVGSLYDLELRDRYKELVNNEIRKGVYVNG